MARGQEQQGQKQQGQQQAHELAGTVETAPRCNTPADVYAFPARRAVGRVLRTYLDNRDLTPLEFLCSPEAVHDLVRGNHHNLFATAVHRVAAVQPAKDNETSRARADLLFRLAERLLSEVVQRPDVQEGIGRLHAKGMDGLLALVHDMPADARSAYIRFALAAHLGEAMGWRGKLALLADHLHHHPAAEGMAWLDDAIAELLDPAETIKEALGNQPDTGTGLAVTARLCTDRLPENTGVTRVLARLGPFLASGALPNTRTVLLDRVARTLGGTRSLTRTDAAGDQKAFDTLLAALGEADGPAGGSAMMEAAVQRAMPLFGDTEHSCPPGDAVVRVLRALPAFGPRLGGLLALTETGFAAEHDDAIPYALPALAKANSPLWPSDADDAACRAARDSLKARLAESPVPAAWRDTLASILDGNTPDLPPEADTAPDGGGTARTTMDHRHLNAGDVLFHEGEPGTEAYIVASGALRISRHNDDGETLLATARRGDLVGEMALIDGKPRSATVTAVEPTTLTVIPQDAFQKRLDRLARHDRVLRRLLDVLVERLRQ